MRYLLAGLLFAAVTSIATPALAHPVPQSYSPDDGATISAPPSEAAVEFNERINEGTLVVYDPCGQRVDDGSSDVLLTRVSVGVSADKAGTYTAVWTVIGEDGHKVSGDWNFTVTDGEACPGSEPEDPQDGSNDNDDSAEDDDTDVSASGGSNENDATEVASGEPSKNKNGNRDKGKGEGKHNGHKNEDDGEPSAPEGDTGNGVPVTNETPVSDDIPLDWLMISFGVAALIGAAAGRVYVNLIPPR